MFFYFYWDVLMYCNIALSLFCFFFQRVSTWFSPLRSCTCSVRWNWVQFYVEIKLRRGPRRIFSIILNLNWDTQEKGKQSYGLIQFNFQFFFKAKEQLWIFESILLKGKMTINFKPCIIKY